jgi:hypothetical protein
LHSLDDPLSEDNDEQHEDGEEGFNSNDQKIVFGVMLKSSLTNPALQDL